jgi:hypothetical protein
MLTDFILNAFGCPPLIVLMLTSFICPFLPLVILAISGKSITIRKKPYEDPDKLSFGNLLAYGLVILYFVYACYAFMIPQGLMGQCGYVK